MNPAIFRKMDKNVSHTLIKSMNYSYSMIAGINTILGICGYTIREIDETQPWWMWLITLILIFITLSTIIFFIQKKLNHHSYSTLINGKTISIKVGNIFEEHGLKIIPCNEYFDTQVDDITIAHNTLNGKMIDYFINNLEELNKKIKDAEYDSSELKPYKDKKSKKTKYPLGKIIQYNEFLMLAFSHFNEQNEAYLNNGEYEKTLINMWKEIRQKYAGKAIVMPVLGTGITTIKGKSEKDYTSMLNCILCTLKNSNFQPEQGLTIIMTEETMKKTNMNIIRRNF